jgi:hypothetical protein
MSEKASQDYYKDHLSHCYGCGGIRCLVVPILNETPGSFKDEIS